MRGFAREHARTGIFRKVRTSAQKLVVVFINVPPIQASAQIHSKRNQHAMDIPSDEDGLIRFVTPLLRASWNTISNYWTTHIAESVTRREKS